MALSAPTNIHMTSVTPTTITVGWDPVPGATYYRLAINPPYPQTPSTGNIAGTSHTFTGLISSTYYYVYVWAYSDTDSSPYGMSGQIYTAVVAPPANLRVTSQTATTINIAWDPGEGVVKYSITWGSYAVNDYTGTTLALHNYGPITALTTYTIQARAFGANSASTWASIQTTTPSDPAVLAQPTGLQLVSQTPTSVNISWLSVLDATSYDVHSISSQSGTQVLQGNTIGTSMEITGLLSGPGQNYVFYVTAKNGIDPDGSPQSAGLNVAMQSMPATTNFRTTGNSLDSISFAWDANPYAHHYKLAYNHPPGTPTATYTGDIYGTTHTLTGLNPATEYTNIILYTYSTVSNIAGYVVTSINASTGTLPAPTGLHWVSSTTSSIQVQWDAYNPPVTLTGYQLTISGPGITTGTAIAYTGTQHTFTAAANGIQPNEYYDVAVQGVPTGGTASPYSDPIQVYSGTLPVPEVPQNIRGTARTNTSISIEWDPSADATSYETYLNGNPVEVTTSTFAIFSGLSPETSYNIQVRSANLQQESALSPVVVLSTQAPPIAVVLSSPASSGSDIALSPTLTWVASSVIEDVISYDVQVATSSLFSSPIVDATVSGAATETYVPSGLLPQVQYFWRVRATNSLGDGAWSQTWNFTTLTLTAPTLLSPAQNEQDVSSPITFSWEESPGDEQIVGYQLQVDTTPSFNSIPMIVDETLSGISTTSFLSASLESSVQYYWRVRARDSGGNYSAWTTRYFTTAQLPPELPVRGLPTSGQTTTLGTVFTWTPGARADEHMLRIARDFDFNNIISSVDGLAGDAANQFIVLPDPNQTFYWKIGARNSGGEVWSSVGQFTTEDVSITLTAPNGVVLSDFNPTGFFYTVKISWNSVTNATSYVVCHNNDGLNTTQAPAVGGSNAPAVIVPVFRTGESFIAWVVAYGAGGQSRPSASVTITVPAEQSGDGHLSVDRHDGDDATLSLRNLRSQGVVTNDIYYNAGVTDLYVTSITEPVSPDPYYAAILTDLLGNRNATYVLKRISKVSGGGTYATSSLTTPTPPAAPSIASVLPGNGQVQINWGSVTGASQYYVFVDGRYRMTVPTTTATVDGLSNEQSYAFTIRAYNAAGSGEASQAYIASPTNLPPPPTTFTAVYNQAINAFELNWSLVGSGAGYKVFYRTNPNSQTWDGTGLKRSGQAASSPVTVNSNSTSSMVLTDVVYGNPYWFAIGSINGSGDVGILNELPNNITMAIGIGSQGGSSPQKIGLQVNTGTNAITASWEVPE